MVPARCSWPHVDLANIDRSEKEIRTNRLTKALLPLRTGMQFLVRTLRYKSSTRVVPSLNDCQKKNCGGRVRLPPKLSGSLIPLQFAEGPINLFSNPTEPEDARIEEHAAHGRQPGRQSINRTRAIHYCFPRSKQSASGKLYLCLRHRCARSKTCSHKVL